MTTFEMLQELLAQNEFELLLPEDHTANTTEQDIRLVYQMNDTVESFLVFREAIFTGTYKKDYEGKLDASYDRDQDRYVLGVRQGDSVITLFYQKLELEVNLYNYGEIAHFRWCKSSFRKYYCRIFTLHRIEQWINHDGILYTDDAADPGYCIPDLRCSICRS